MTAYVDNFRVPKRVGRISGLWSHLTADTVAELEWFARQLGLRPEWFQTCRHGLCDPCSHWHYDVTERKRVEAVELGAREISLRDMGALTSTRRGGRELVAPNGRAVIERAPE